jgi:hypothetical protein
VSRHSVQDAELAALYERVPSIPGCKGHCWLSCGPIDMASRERQRIRSAGLRITDRDEARRQPSTYWCEALGPDGRCAIYALRPLICRLWGTTPALRCPYGCMPEWWLTDMEGVILLAESREVGGYPGTWDTAAELRAKVAASPHLAGWVSDYIRRGNTGDEARLRDYGRHLPAEVASRKPPRVR